MARTLEELIKSVEQVIDEDGEHLHINFEEEVSPEEKKIIMDFVLWNFYRCEELRNSKKEPPTTLRG